MMLYRGILLVATLVLGACGGGDGSGGGGTTTGGTSGGGTGGGTTGGGVIPSNPTFQFDTGIGGSGGVIGNIDGFGSIIVNGLELETDGETDVYIEGVEGFTQDDLREGYYVVVAGDISGLDADEVFYRSNIKGVVTSGAADDPNGDPLTGSYRLSVMGQTVITSSSTRLNGVLVENIAQGDLLEVSGPIDGNGQVIATYIELKDPLSLTEYKAIGVVSGLDDLAGTFELGGLMVDYGSAPATFSEFEGADLADGQLVEVKMAAADFTAPASAIASEVELLPVPQIDEGAEVEVEGLIDRFDSATDFSVSGVDVTTNGGTTYEGGDPSCAGTICSSLGINVKLEVEGTADADGVIVAEDIEFKTDNAIRVEGQVTVNVSASTVTAMGVTYEVRASTEMEDDSAASVEPFTLNELMDGDYVEVRGFLDGSTVVAVELEREDDPNPGENRALLRGPLTAFNQAASTVEIQLVTVNDLVGTTAYEDENENPIINRDDFYNLLQVGSPLKAEWDDFSSLAQPADKLSLEDDD